MELLVDFHAHFMPGSYAEKLACLLEKTGNSDDSPRLKLVHQRALANLRMGDALTNAERRIADMDRLGIDTQVLSLAAANVFALDTETNIELATTANDGLAEVVDRYPDRFLALATLPLLDVQASVDELQRAVERLGMRGAIIGTNISGLPLSDERFTPVFELLDRHRLPVLLHPTIPPGVEQMGEYNLESSVGYLFDTTLAAARMAFSGVLERFPNIRFIVPHFGGVIPFIHARVDNAFRLRAECRENISIPPSHYFKKLYVDCVSSNFFALRYTIDFVGIDRIVFGTDFPHVIGGEPAQLLAMLEQLSEEARQSIYSENSLDILGLH
ncbi:MAG: amidohydrolase [Chloroflexi bacterium]|nr:amidohydrolase [Chloroflexota bacterium]